MTNLPNPAMATLASLKKKNMVYDLLRPGQGTPWENKGEHGVVGSFLKTCMRSITKPGLLLDHIRATNTAGDARSFAWLCAVVWGISVMEHNVLLYFYYTNDPKLIVEPSQFMMNTALQTGLTIVWVYLMMAMAASIYHKLAQTELKQPLPAVLVTNIFCYGMGPSILSLIPVIGPPLALIAIFCVLVVAGRKRLYIPWRGAIIDGLLAFVAALGLTAALYFVGGFIWSRIMDAAVYEKPPVKPKPNFG